MVWTTKVAIKKVLDTSILWRTVKINDKNNLIIYIYLLTLYNRLMHRKPHLQVINEIDPLGLLYFNLLNS